MTAIALNSAVTVKYVPAVLTETNIDSMAFDAKWLESSKGFSRYIIDEEGNTAWYCDDCGEESEDPCEGCAHCGNGCDDDVDFEDEDEDDE